MKMVFLILGFVGFAQLASAATVVCSDFGGDAAQYAHIDLASGTATYFEDGVVAELDFERVEDLDEGRVHTFKSRSYGGSDYDAIVDFNETTQEATLSFEDDHGHVDAIDTVVCK